MASVAFASFAFFCDQVFSFFCGQIFSWLLCRQFLSWFLRGQFFSWFLCRQFLSWLSLLDHRCQFAQFEDLFRIGGGKKVHAPGDYSGPAGLVAGAQTSAGVAVKIFVELDVIPPVRISLQFLRLTVHRTPAILSFQEHASKSA